MTSTSQCVLSESKVVERETEDRLQLDHRLDSLILLVYVILLVLSVITIWTFKHRRFRYFHETGLSVIYGLIVGIALRYGMKPSKLSVEYHNLEHNVSSNSTCGSRLPPQKLIARLPVRDLSGGLNVTMLFQYGFEQLTPTDIPFNNKATFNPEIFFNVLLPPIIFSAGYSMKRNHFFQNIGAILTYAFLGTFLSAFVAGTICYALTRMISSLAAILSFADCLLFGSIISATDPVTVLAIFNDLGVDPHLYALVFGESVLNDALAIALSQSVEEYGSKSAGSFDASALLSSVSHFSLMFGGSFCIGVVVGMLTALLTKFTHIREHPILETTLFVLMSYSTFLLAETVGFTGIVAVLFCGIIQAHYTYNNLSEESKLWTKQFFELLNFLSENFVFAYIGVSTFTYQQHYWDVRFVFIALLACIIARMVSVYPVSALINLCRGYRQPCFPRHRGVLENDQTTTTTAPPLPGGSMSFRNFHDTQNAIPHSHEINRPRDSCTKITWNMQHMIFFSGLRGAMAFSLAIRNTSSPMRQMFFSTTIVVVMTTVLLCGGLVMTMLSWLKIRTSVETHDRQDEESLNIDLTDFVGARRSRSWFNYYWYRFDRFYLMPLLTNRGPPLTESVPWCCFRVAKLLTTDEQYAQHISSQASRTKLNDVMRDHDSTTDSVVMFSQSKADMNRLSASLKLDTAMLDPEPYQTPQTDSPANCASATPQQTVHSSPTDPSANISALFLHQRFV
ncbi:Sodium/hydrogen exchanger 9 [Clonorchis sinensis]|uniref:Sodium/hydrogen exchanger n=1 Tax=Clonorchis sinensis TaxID=79923 RepID=A0A8T1MD89_CLOSI|nr:Sodium/hydrogen exchanger 9 [Clonorchis sinensis]